MNLHLIKNTKIFTVVFASISFIACSSKNNKENDVAQTTKPIAVTTAKPTSFTDGSLHFSGRVEASQSATISTRVMGVITMLKVNVGEHVSKGQLLVSINSDEIRAKKAQTEAMIAEAEAAYKNAQKDVERFTNLYKQQSCTAKELDNVMLQYNSIKAKLDGAKQMRNEVNAMLNYTNLTAPFSGIITQKMASAGSMASPGMPLLTIEQAGTLQINASVPESEITEIKVGKQVDVNVKSANKNFKGVVALINTSSQFTGGLYNIKISIPEADKKSLLSGMYADVYLSTSTPKEDNSKAILIPASSIEYKNELTGIYTVGSNHTALLRWVRLGKKVGDKVEILSGLNKDETYIISADEKLFNGATVIEKNN
ncbi:MAG: efflux RND transporter periplasmic adaptor subunit [Chitinophagales bacterium]|nr:efflux RND transporter periplasmic adaptor subunit [Chitinophagales bacterium]